MDGLNVLRLYNESDNKKRDKFSNNLNSELRIKSDSDKVTCNFEWLELMEDTIPYIDNILRNPNRFIINEEDVIKIELAKRVTVESIKHLSKNTNLIQEYDKKTGDVKPSKILNITKEESYDTYENRLIYTLIQNMKFYIERVTKDISFESSSKEMKSFQYNANTSVGHEKLDINMNLNSKFSSTHKEVNAEGLGIEERLEKLRINIAALTNSDVYKTIEKKHIALITPPIKKTNVIIKNVNFQYAMKLWEFLQSNVPSSNARKKDSKDYVDSGEVKDLVDETFFLNYLIMDSLNSVKLNDKEVSEIQDRIVNNMISQVIKVNDKITEEQLKDIIGKQFTIVKYKNVVSDKNIRKIFKDNISKYFDKITRLK